MVPATHARHAGTLPERHTRIATRRAFVQAKRGVADCVASMDASAPLTTWLAQEVRQTHEPEDLWLLRNALFAALRRQRAVASHATRLRRTLADLFPTRFADSGFGDAMD